MEGKCEGELFALMGGLLQEITDVIVVLKFGGWVYKMRGQMPQT